MFPLGSFSTFDYFEQIFSAVHNPQKIYQQQRKQYKIVDYIDLVLTVVASRSLSVSQVLGYTRKSELECRGLQTAETAEWKKEADWGRVHYHSAAYSTGA